MEESAGIPAEQHEARAHPWILLVAGAILALLLIQVLSLVDAQGFTTHFDSLLSTDIEQARIDTPLPAPQGDHVLLQSFIPRHNGLSEVEVTLLRYGEPAAGEDSRLTLQVWNGQEELVAEQEFPTASLAHNQVVRLPLAEQHDSRGQRYYLRLSGTEGNPVSVWGYSLDAYEGGALAQEAGQSAATAELPARDLRFVTRYRLNWLDALANAGETLFYEGLIFLIALLLLPLPGLLLLLAEHAYRVRHLSAAGEALHAAWDPAAWWGAALALGVAAWPVLWSWLTMFGVRWTPWLLVALTAAGWLAAVSYAWRERRVRLAAHDPDGGRAARPPIAGSWHWDHLLLLAILILGFVLRLIAVRDTPVLPWVDASRHALITAVMANTGQTISDYAPYLPVERFPYHFGFHTLASSLYLLTAWPLERLLLYLGQLLNALVPFTMFAATWLLVRRRPAAYLAAFLVALPFFFPAYYTTWGRLTQLTAVLILPLLLAFTWLMVHGRETWIDRWWLVGILAAGLFLVHFRVLVYYLPFPLVALLLGRFRHLRWLVAAAVLSLILVAPRIFGLLNDTDPVQRLGRTIPDYNNFPVDYVTTGWEAYFLWTAAAGLALVLVAFLLRRTWAYLPLALVGWIASLFALLSLDRIGLPVPSLFNLNSMYIILFVPLAIFLSLVVDQIWQWLDRQQAPVRVLGYGLSGALLAALLLFGVRRQVMILNQQTLLAQTEDLIALRWLEEHLPQDAHIAVNSWRWLGETWAGADGGAWILPLTGRSVTTPPIDHIYSAELFQQVREFNRAAAAVSDWSDPQQVDWLKEQGVSHIFVGKRGGYFDPAKLAANPSAGLLYAHDGVYVFELEQ